MIAEILSTITVGVVMAHLIKDAINDRRQKKLDEQRIQIEQRKANATIIDAFGNLPNAFNAIGTLLDTPMFKNPKEFKEKFKELLEIAKEFQKG